MSNDSKLPLVYSCSGASSAAQMTNHIAVKLDRLKIAEMSCIAGMGGDVKPLVKTAKSGRPIIALDGCPLRCAAQILKRHGLTADRHYALSEMGVPKKKHEDFDPDQAAEILQRVVVESKVLVLHTSVAAESAPSPDAPEEELPEPFSPVCYAKEFKDW
jgi:uncharacterized metal-binding protein